MFPLLLSQHEMGVMIWSCHEKTVLLSSDSCVYIIVSVRWGIKGFVFFPFFVA